MKKRDKDELHGMTTDALKKKVVEFRKQLIEARLATQTKDVKNRKIVKELRKRLAVTLSILRTKELT